MKNPIKKILIAVLFIAAVSCGSNNEIKVVDKNFDEEVESFQNLIFKFNQEIVADSLLDVWMDTKFVEFKPDIKGRFKWKGKNELIFSPLEAFKPATPYQAMLGSVLQDVSGGKYSVTLTEQIAFKTADLSVISNDLFWSKSNEKSGSIVLRGKLKFNYNVDPKDLSGFVKVSIDGKSLTPEIVTQSITSDIEFQYSNADLKWGGKKITTELGKGLKPKNSEGNGIEGFTTESVVPEKDELTVLSAIAEKVDEAGQIRVYTNQSVEQGDVRSLIKIEPVVPLTTEWMQDGFIIKGNFVPGVNYELIISKKIKGIFGTGLAADYKQNLTFGDQRPSIKFTSNKGMYLTNQGEKQVGVLINAVAKVKVTIVKIYENNINAFLRRGNSSGYYYDSDSDEYEENTSGGFFYGYYDWEEFGDRVLEKVYETKNLKKINNNYLLTLDLQTDDRFKGIFVVNVESDEDQWVRSNKVIALSDIGLIVKLSENDLWVFTNSIKTTESLDKVRVKLISSNNQIFYSDETNGNGVLHIENYQKISGEFRIVALSAEKDGDFNFINLRDTKTETSRFDVGGLRTNSVGYNAYIYGERELYRPGEIIKGNVIVRQSDWTVNPDFPVKIKLLLPNGKTAEQIRKTINKQGAAEFAFSTQESYVTGTYGIEVYSANDILLGSKSIGVEEFIPDRIKVVMSTDKTDYKLSDKIEVNATATNLFGPPAKDRKFEMNVVLAREPFQPAGFKNYNFGIVSKNDKPFNNFTTEGTTDAEGKINLTYKADAITENIGRVSAKVFVSVFDETGRPVNRVKKVNIWTQNVFFGIHNIGSYLATQDPVTIPIAAVDQNGKWLDGQKANIKVIRSVWQSVMQKNSWGGYRYVSQKQEFVMKDENLTISGQPFNYVYTPMESGEYEIRVSKPDAAVYVSESFYAYRWGNTQASSFQVSTEGQIIIESNKDKYEPGEKAEIIFKTPFAGKLLVTIERNKVIDHYYLDTDKKSAMMNLNITDEFVPNIYISAILFRPVDDGSMPVTVATGIHPILVEQKKNILPIAIQSVDQTASSKKQTLTISTEPNTELTISVVDEGILQLKDTKTPNPYSYFYQKRALEVDGYNIYAFLLPEYKSNKSSSGGDGYDLARRINPFTNKRVKPVSFWSGIIKSDDDGEAKFEIDIPKFSGSVRVMVAAYNKKSFGSAEKMIKIADPVVISTALPRFMSPGDEIPMAINLTNTTASAKTINVTVNSKGIITFGESKKTLTLQPNAEQRLEFPLKANNGLGVDLVQVFVSGDNLNLKEETDITVRRLSSLQKLSSTGEILSGKTLNLNLSTDYLNGTGKFSLRVGRSPITALSNDLLGLLEYPYGCAEQTISTAFPQLYLADLVKQLSNNVSGLGNSNYNVQQAIRKLETLQQSNGGLSYWEGGQSDDWWVTVYGLHFMYEAKKSGFEVSPLVFDKMIEYVSKKYKQNTKESYFYINESNNVIKKQIYNKEIFYSMYVLALTGKSDLSLMNYYRINQNDMALDSKYLLAASYLLIGDQNAYQKILPSAFNGEMAKTAFSGSYSSYVRDMGMVLNTLLETDSENQQIPIIAQRLSTEMKKKKYLSTQETAFALLGLGKLAKKANKSAAEAEILLDGKSLGKSNGKDFIFSGSITGKNLTIQTKGNGSVYYSFEQSGIPVNGPVVLEDRYLKARRTFYNRNGQMISGNSFKQNDLIVVKLTLQTTDLSTVKNVALTDLLPAGFEIENPRVSAVPELNWIMDQSAYDHFDIRDDRITYFTTASSTEVRYYYLVRAVTKGKFIQGPVSADAMYDGEYHSYFGSGAITVE